MVSTLIIEHINRALSGIEQMSYHMIVSYAMLYVVQYFGKFLPKN